ncbi:hypothetical protein C8J56DRAFT_328397 [Mycena floridula]|nr:hypothetical protein C8J56DRAFT_328397 [Mycena floridula]
MPRKSTNSPLFATNEPPSAAEEAALQDVFDGIDEDIHETHQEVLRLEASLKAAWEEHAQLLEVRTAHRLGAIMSPVRRLPSDVVFEILRWSSTRKSAPSSESLPVVTLDQEEGPWPFMSVCRHWRTVITSHPTFWCAPEPRERGYSPLSISFTSSASSLIERFPKAQYPSYVVFPCRKSLFVLRSPLGFKLSTCTLYAFESPACLGFKSTSYPPLPWLQCSKLFQYCR